MNLITMEQFLLWQELSLLLQNIGTAKVSAEVTPEYKKRYVYGVQGIAETFGCRTPAVAPTALQENTGCNTLSEDLSYSYLLSLGIKRDTGPYNGETTWNAMSDDEKRTAIAYVKQNITDNASKRNTLYASKFLGSNVWKTKA